MASGGDGTSDSFIDDLEPFTQGFMNPSEIALGYGRCLEDYS